MPDARTLYREAFAHYAEGRIDEAIAGYRSCLEQYPDYALAWNGLAMALAQKEDFDGAIEAGKRLVALEPDEPLPHTSLSMFYQRKGMIPEAEDEMALAMQLTLQKQQT